MPRRLAASSSLSGVNILPQDFLKAWNTKRKEEEDEEEEDEEDEGEEKEVAADSPAQKALMFFLPWQMVRWAKSWQEKTLGSYLWGLTLHPAL